MENDLILLIEQAFAPDGAIAARMATRGIVYHLNPGQVDYARAIARSLTQAAPVTLMEGETGTGKSLGYALPAALLAASKQGSQQGRVIISTFTLRLQDQLAKKDLPLAVEVAGDLLNCPPPTFAVRRGMRNFVWPTRAREVSEALNGSAAIDDLLAWNALPATSGVIQDWIDGGGILPPGIQASDLCLLPHAGMADGIDMAKYKAHVVAAADADIMVVTHALLAINTHLWFSVFNGGRAEDSGKTTPFALAIVDEADRLETAAENIFEQTISLRELRRFEQNLRQSGSKPQSLTAGLDAIEATMARMEHQNQPFLSAETLSGKKRSDLIGAAEQLVKGLSAAVTGWRRTDQGAVGWRMEEDVEQYIHATKWAVKAFIAALTRPDGNAMPLLRWSPTRRFPALEVVARHPGRLASRLWMDGGEYPPFAAHVVLTSATLDAPGRVQPFKAFMTEIGLHQACLSPHSATFAPKRFGRMEIVVADPTAPRPSAKNNSLVDDEHDVQWGTSADWLDYAANGIATAHRQKNQRVLALCLSYRDTTALAARLTTMGLTPIVQVQGMSLAEGRARFAVDPKAIWLTPVGWEGLDLPGLVDNLVITRLPFSSSGGAREMGLRSALKARGYANTAIDDIVRHRATNLCKRMLRQGIGRALRQPDDATTLWILDPRFMRASRLAGQRQGSDGWTACIPERFRSGIDNALARAQIFSSIPTHPFSTHPGE